MGEHFNIIIVLIIIGLSLIGLGVGARLGSFKTLYLIRGIPGIYPSGYVYAFIPAGLGFLMLAFVLFMQNRSLAQDIVIYGLSSLILLSIILMTWKPRWLKPWWLKWLEDNYGHILEVMLDEARNTWSLENQPHTEADLEAWAEAVRRKYGR